MNKLRKIVFVLIMVFSLSVIASCDGEEKSLYDIEDLEALEFNDKTVEYDGESHSIVIENVPEGIDVTYTNNERTIPGTYQIDARIVFEELVVKKQATLTITKQASVLSAEDNQVLYLYGGNLKPQYSISTKNQSVTITYYQNGVEVSKDALYAGGSFTAELYAKSNTYYEESNHVTISLEVKNSSFGLSFEDVTAEYDGDEKEIKLTGTLPDGYTVNYTDNKGTDVGCYYAKAEVCDASGNVVETHAATLEIDYPKNQEFEEYLDDFFVLYLEGDQLSVNIFCVNPEDFGLTHYDANWYTYTSHSDNDYAAEALAEFEGYYNELLAFKDAQLSSLQRVSYNNIESFLNYYIEYYSIPDSYLMEIVYVDQFGGYVADFGTYMEAYSLRSEAEVVDVINYVESTLTAFPSYLEFVSDKEEAGYALSDYTITEMRSYLSDVLAEGENYYLEDVIITHINEVDFLSDSQKSDYASQVTAAFKNCFIPGVQALYDGLESHLGKLASENEGYWSVYENGQALYELELEDLLGLDLDMDAYIKELDTAIKEGVSKVISAQSAMTRLGANSSDYPISLGQPEQMLEYLKEFAKTIVPELETTPNISVKEMDNASAAVSNAVAYYMKSALDNYSSEHITLNPLKLGDSNDVLGTLSHEGYPGHLYAYVYSKQLDLHNVSKIMTSTAHGEGWATYVELKLYEYAKEQSDDAKFDAVMDYLYANQILGFLLETRLDAGVHYQGWKAADVAKYMRNAGYNSDEESAKEIFNLLIEMPSGYAAYGYGKLTFVKLHNQAKNILGGFYDEIEFNAMLLSKGWTDLGELQNTYNEYMMKKCHQYGLEFSA